MSTNSTRDNGGWFKSSYSTEGGTACVEARYRPDVPIGVRDSKRLDEPEQVTLAFSPSVWSAFVTHLAG